MSRIHHYISMIIFTAAVLIGVQLPNFVDQYIKRIDAHLKEVDLQYQQYDKIASRFGMDSIKALIRKYENSDDEAIRAGAEPIRKNYQRKQLFEAEMKALQGSFWRQAVHVMFAADRDILHETYESYSANLPLNTYAVVCGLSFGLIASVVLELLWSLFMRLTFRRPKRPPKPKHKNDDTKPPRSEPFIRT